MKKVVRITHTVEFVLDTQPEPAYPARYGRPGVPIRSAEEVAERVLQTLEFSASRGENPTSINGQFGAYYDLKRTGKPRVTVIEVEDAIRSTTEAKTKW